MSPLSDDELAARAVAVLLNKVGDLDPWYYFDVEIPKSQPTSFDLLEKLEPSGDRYRWDSQQHGAVTAEDAFKAVLASFKVRPGVAALAFRRIFDIDAIENDSGASSGFLGKLNAAETERRAKASWKRLQGLECRNKRYVVAEGDSWFQFPRTPPIGNPVKDLIEHLMDREDLCIETSAAGGDWLSNMLKSREYLSVLSQVEPDVFLFSGGGNDMLGDGRAGNMVVHRRWTPKSLPELGQRLLEARNAGDLITRQHFDAERFESGLKLLSIDFLRFLNLVFVQYLLFLWNLREAKRFKTMAIVTQGYDFVIPKRKSTAKLLAFRQRLVNKRSNSGQWLWGPLEKKGLTDREKRNALYAMLQEYNELLISIVKSGLFDPIFHIDSRGLAKRDDWFDEIHLKSDSFKDVARLYYLCMHEFFNGKTSGVYSAEDDLKRAQRLWR